MKIAEINSVCFGSTGKIMHDIGERAISEGHVVRFFIPNTSNNNQRKNAKDELFGNFWLRNISRKIAYYTGLHHLLFLNSTLSLIIKLRSFKPDLIHFHNLHENFLNIPLLFYYISCKNIRVIWTLHDCWAFTGHCPYYDMANCQKWKTHCYDCPIYQEYPSCKRDDSKLMYRQKQKWIEKIEDLTLVPVSYWLEGELRQSFLKNRKTVVIHNGINLDLFHPYNSDTIIEKYRSSHKIEKWKMVALGCALSFGERKGYSDFLDLAKKVGDECLIIMVGVTKEQIAELPSNIIGICRTDNQQELAQLYSCSDIFLNLTYEDNYPTTNLESMACGTPVLTYRTGGSIEAITDDTGWIVEQGNIEEVSKIIKHVSDQTKNYMREACIERALSEFDKSKCFNKYMDLFKQERYGKDI